MKKKKEKTNRIEKILDIDSELLELNKKDKDVFIKRFVSGYITSIIKEVDKK